MEYRINYPQTGSGSFDNGFCPRGQWFYATESRPTLSHRTEFLPLVSLPPPTLSFPTVSPPLTSILSPTATPPLHHFPVARCHHCAIQRGIRRRHPRLVSDSQRLELPTRPSSSMDETWRRPREAHHPLRQGLSATGVRALDPLQPGDQGTMQLR
jgi:hypothetical protein